MNGSQPPTQSIKGNAHTHTKLCHHATGMPVDYALAAREKGLQVLGFTDHTPFPDNRWLHVRMHMDDLPTYIQGIEEARAACPELRILSGLECEYVSEFHNFYEDELLGAFGFDYLILGIHWFLHEGEWLETFGQSDTPERLASYTRHTIQGMSTGLFSFLAHPDIFGNDYFEWDHAAETAAHEITTAAVALNMPLEINGLGFRRTKVQTPTGQRNMYPLEPFWEIAAQQNVNVVANSDAHRPEDIIANIDDALNLAEKHDLPIINPADLIT